MDLGVHLLSTRIIGIQFLYNIYRNIYKTTVLGLGGAEYGPQGFVPFESYPAPLLGIPNSLAADTRSPKRGRQTEGPRLK